MGWSRAFILVLLVLVVGVPFIVRPASPASRHGDGSGPRLVIVSPHNEQIRFEFSRAFNAWRAGRGGSPVTFDWRSGSGTSDLRRQVLAEFTKAAEAGREDEGVGYDLFFGGGEYDHDRLARGVRVERGAGGEKRVRITEVVPMPAARLEAIYPTPTIGGERLYHKDRAWLGTALSSFGIVYNRDVLEMLGLPEPSTWSDLADPRYRGWLALADPGHSGSITSTYNTILRRLGWTEGWRVLRRTFANARYFARSSSQVPVDVSSGDAVAGMCIDFYGRFQAGAVAAARRIEKRSTTGAGAGDAAERSGAGGRGRVGYVDPPFMTAITADPITLLRGAPNQEVAIEFVQWVLSREGQRLWQRRCGSPGGPQRFELRRLPIRRDLYEPEETAFWTDGDVRPYEIAKPFPAGMPSFFSTVSTVCHAIAIDLHDDLVAAWQAFRESAGHPRHAEMAALFDEMPPALVLRWPDAELRDHWRRILEDPEHPRHAEVAAVLREFVASITDPWRADPDRRIHDRLAWTLFFRDRYHRILALGE